MKSTKVIETTLYIRNFPRTLQRELQDLALETDKSVKQLVAEAISEYICLHKAVADERQQ